MLRINIFIITIFLAISAGFSHDIPEMPMPITKENSLVYTWLHKPVHESKLLNDMETLSSWKHLGSGEIEISEERVKSGNHSLKMTSKTFTVHPSKNGRPPGTCSALFEVDQEDWSASNRLSFWVYPDWPGFRTISMLVKLKNEGTITIPDEYGRLGLNYFLLDNQRWNQIVWEIPHLSRDKVTGVEFVYRMQGNEPGATDTVHFYLDHLELQKVDADHYLGWNVAPGKIAYSHTGYPLASEKLALGGDLKAKEFTLHAVETDAVILRKPIQNKQTKIGEFQILEFSSIKKTGSYYLKAGDIKTEAFKIGKNIWDKTIWKTINCFYCLRCGMEIPGIHGTCHEDWLAEHDGKKITYNGGWHDAGDLSQGLRNTSEAAYAMFLLAEQLPNAKHLLKERLLDEAKWGLDWILKNRLGDGFRCRWGTMDFWTDNIIGTVDDMITTSIANDPYDNFHASAAEAIAYRLLKNSNPYMANRSLQYAREDWRYAMKELVGANRESPNRLNTIAIGAIASLELFRSTNENFYMEKAIELAEKIMACQQKSKPDWDIPLTGFFYQTPNKKRIQHYAHIGEIQSPIVTLVMLCELLPEHQRSHEWKHSVELYADYLKTISRFTAPYYMFPASIYNVNESNNEKFKEQVKNGIRLSEDHYLRRFPVWYAFRGNYGVLLSQTRALSAAARLLQDCDLWNLVHRQLECVVGLNPFCQSTMYGEGYNFAPQYTATSGDIVGGLPVGIQSSRNNDEPFWPADNCYNFKEIWVHPSSRWLAIMADIELMNNEK